MIWAQFAGAGVLRSGNLIPFDASANGVSGEKWEQAVGRLAKDNAGNANFHIAVVTIPVYNDSGLGDNKAWTQRPVGLFNFMYVSNPNDDAARRYTGKTSRGAAFPQANWVQNSPLPENAKP